MSRPDSREGETMDKLRVETLVLGELGTNGYLVMNRETKELVLVDPAAEADRIRRKVSEMGGVPAAVLLTHGHYDHIGAVSQICEAFHIPCYALETERELLSSTSLNLSQMFGRPMTLLPDEWLRDGQELTMAGRTMRVLATPGHTSGSASYYFPQEDILFSGDTLFCGSVGRSDFPTGSASTLVRSIREKLLTLPEETAVYPGHEAQTTIGEEKRYNPFL